LGTETDIVQQRGAGPADGFEEQWNSAMVMGLDDAHTWELKLMIENGGCRESAEREAARFTHEKNADEPVTGTVTKDSPEGTLSPNEEEMFSSKLLLD